MTSTAISSVLIVGGGTAGWLTAALLAKKHAMQGDSSTQGLQITVVEAPDIPIIGVGEGTWPSMRSTLHSIGIKEEDFIKECDASFKQGSKFIGWKNGSADDFYYHPFDLPQDFVETNLAQHWLNTKPPTSFSKMACVQEHLCEYHLSPKLRHSPEYYGVANYGYHFNAGKFSQYLKQYCIDNLGVTLVLDRVTDIKPVGAGDYAEHIRGVNTEKSGELKADLFVDCTGFRSLLLGQHYRINFIDKSAEFPINSALAVQVPYQAQEPIKSATLSTAQDAGWIWDIGLSHRRGVGHVYSNNHTSDEQASQALQSYLGLESQEFDKLALKSIPIKPGYREKFWHKNCVAVGLSAGFLEPLEASAMMLIETSVNMISELLPTTRDAMDAASSTFNQRNHYRWQRVIDFLKLHYLLSDRQQAFWRDASSHDHISERLKEDLSVWQHSAPWQDEFNNPEEAFPAASYQYVLYGMEFNTRAEHAGSSATNQAANTAVNSVAHNARLLASKAVGNRDILSLING